MAIPLPNIILICFLLFPGMSPGQDLARYEFDSLHMGTKFRLVFYASDDSLAKEASNQAFHQIQRLNSILSDYKKDSELNRLSRQSGTAKWIPVSSSLYEILSFGEKLSQATNGAFDITVGPYVTLWRALRRSYAPDLPNPDTLKKIAESVGYHHIQLDPERQAVQLTRPNMQLDPGGIAKGYAADKALEVLESYGISAALVDAGGDITIGDPPPGKEGWKITIQTYSSEGEHQATSLVLANNAIATSGDLYNHVTINNKRYSHIIDPRTGLGLTDQSMVTVIAPNGVTADSYASAISVLGIDKGIQLLSNTSDIEGHIVAHQGDEVELKTTEGFERLKRKSKQTDERL